MACFDYAHAIARVPSRNVVHGLSEDASATPDFEKIVAEHRGYVSALRGLGLAIDTLPALDAFPDSVFVEDPAFVIPEGAILLRPGAPSRLGEREEMRDALKRHFGQNQELADGEYADGGDVLITPQTIFIGLSKRTNRAGAESLQAKLKALGRDVRIVQTPPVILHFKTASSLLTEDTILCTAAMAQSGVFDGLKLVITPEGEEAAANALRVKDTILLGDSFPRTRDLIRELGLSVQTLAITEIGKLDAGLSCMSLRW
ncbi:MAG TPA: arginine deiminase family protein [Rhizomicrobium sp.]|jgi:dimethylargininase